MTDPLQTAIATVLTRQKVGLFRKSLFERLDGAIADITPDRISMALNTMLKSGHVEKSARMGLDGSRWSLTPRGRAYYSTLNWDDDDETATQTEKPVCEDRAQMASAELALAQNHRPMEMAAVGTVPGSADIGAHLDHEEPRLTHGEPEPLSVFADDDDWDSRLDKTAVIQFALNDTLDRALYGLVKLIKDVAQNEPETTAIDRKTEKLALLERLENNDLYPDDVRSLLWYIRMDIQQLEDAS